MIFYLLYGYYKQIYWEIFWLTKDVNTDMTFYLISFTRLTYEKYASRVADVVYDGFF